MKKLAILFFLSAGCAELPPVHTTLAAQSLKATSTPELTQSGVTVAVKPITYVSWKEHPGLMTHIAWYEPDRNAPVAANSNALPTVRREADIAMVPLPAVLVKINNGSDKTLRFGNVAITLAGGDKQFKMIDSVGDVQGRVRTDLLEAHPTIGENLEPLVAAIAQVPLVSKQLTIAPGQSWSGYLCFQMPVHDADEFDDLMSSIDQLALTIAGLDLDGAAAPSFSFTLARDTVQKAVTCPGDVKKPSFKKCSES